MAQGTLTPLQLTAASALLDNTGIKPLPPALTTAIASFNAGSPIPNFLTAVANYTAASFANATTLTSLMTIGNTTIPALGDSIPAVATNLTAVTTTPAGFAGLIQQTGNNYLGNGDVGRFAQGFMAVQGYINATNQFINSAVNAQTYLGPTFTNMDALTTNSISEVNPDFGNFATDLANQGNLTNLNDIKLYGTPAGLLRQLAAEGNMVGGVFAPVQTPLLAAGLSIKEIQTLLAGPTTVSDNEYLRLQQLAYQGMTNVKGTDLQQVLNILEVTTPNINSMADLLDQTKIFPNSYTTLQTPTPVGPVPVYGTDGSVNMNLADNVSAYLASPNGCEDLGKVIPPAQAVANKAVQVAFEQITNIANTTMPALADTIDTVTRNPWNIDTSYLANAVVADAPAVPTVGNLAQLSPDTVFYRAQQDVPAGVDINNDDYWLPTTLGCGLSTMADLPLIQAQTTAIDPSVAAYFSSNIATGSGPDGTITTCDVIGTAIDHGNIAAQLTIATSAMANIVTLDAGNIANINSAYLAIAGAANATVVVANITRANGNITNIYNNANTQVVANVTALNTAWSAIANVLSTEKTYQTDAGIDYTNLQAGEMVSTMGLVQQLPVYGTQTSSCGPAYFLGQVANTSIIGGQGIVGAMREGKNNQCLGEARLNVNTTPSAALAVTPVPAVIPVY
jgi:hypothetical protein